MKYSVAGSTRQTMVSIAMGAAMLATLASCKDSTDNNPTGISAYVASLTNGDATVSAQVHTGAAPASGEGGPVLVIDSTGALINGGTSIFNLTSSTAFSRIIFALQGVDGYYELNLPSAVTAAQLLLGLRQNPPRTDLQLRFLAGTAGGALGPAVTIDRTLLTAGTGAIQVAVSWALDNDVDLHVVDPNGEEVYYGRKESTVGGKLDIDSNAACDLDHTRVENITFPASAPRGTYTVRVDYWSACDLQDVNNYVVTVHAGSTNRTFTGSFTAADEDSGGEGDGRTITTFTY